MKKNKDLLDDFNFRSESVQDFLSQPPNWMIRWGNTFILIIIATILLISYLIKYPDVISAPVIITSQNPPEKLEARVDSKIDHILVNDHQFVNKKQIMMILQSTADYKDILHLKQIVDSLPPSKIQNFPIEKISRFRLGEVQEEYNNFAKAFQDERLFNQLKPYTPENIATSQNLIEYKTRITNLIQQKELEQTKFDLVKKNYHRSQELFKQGVIAAIELENEKIRFLQAEQNLKNINITLSQTQEAISNLNKTKTGMSINIEKDKTTYSFQTLQLFEQLRKALRQWEQHYLIMSSIEGTVSFQKNWSINQFIKTGDIIVSIFPKNNELLIGKMMIPSINSGKVKPNQKVLIKLDNYNYQEFGIVEGIIQSISLTPDNEGYYYVHITLPRKLKTSFGKNLPFNRELRGDAEIITEDLRLMQRIFFRLRVLLGYQNSNS